MNPHEPDDEAVAASQRGQRAVWNKARCEFELQPAPPVAAAAEALVVVSSLDSSVNGDEVWTNPSLDAALSSLEAGELRSDASIQNFLTARSQLSQRILSSSSPTHYLPGFVAKWSSQLDSFSDNVATSTADFHCTLASLSEEYLEIARTQQSMGEVEEARAHLGKCIALTRLRQQQGNQEDPTDMLSKAKKVLFAYIKFQESMAKCQQLLLRARTPPLILAFLIREVEFLSSQAPFSIQLLKIKTDLQWRTHQYSAIVSSLSTSSLTSMDVHLTLLYARTLEAQGLCQQSLTVAFQWLANENSTICDTDAGSRSDFTALQTHKERIKSLLESKSRAEQLRREENYEEASHSYSQSLKLLGSDCNHVFHASLLLSRANMTLMLVETSAGAIPVETTRLSSAISDLKLSLKLNPSNQLTNLRLDTALLQLETLKLKSRMKIT